MTIDELFDEGIECWKNNKGIGTALIPRPTDNKYFILGVLEKIYNKTPTASTIIVVNTFAERKELNEFLTHQEDEHNNSEFSRLINNRYIRILTIDFIKNSKYLMYPTLTIALDIDTYPIYMDNLMSNSKFKLCVIKQLITDAEALKLMYSRCPLLSCFRQNELDELRLNTPVEERYIGVNIPNDSEDYKLLEYYNKYISTSISLFGSFEIIQQARSGNPRTNVSATAMCYSIAYENGWNEHLDMSVEYNRQLDSLFNPANISDRASRTYEIIRNRSNLLTSYNTKLDKIYEIIETNKDSKILIINKSADFANIVTKYINNTAGKIICGNYHDKVEPMPAVDDYGNPIYIKSGVNKGNRKYFMDKAQRSYNERAFNNNSIRVISANNAPDKSLSIGIDVVIITSPLCESIHDYLYRLSNVKIISNTLRLYSIYVENSIEETKLIAKEVKSNHIILNPIEDFCVTENNCNFMLVE